MSSKSKAKAPASQKPKFALKRARVDSHEVPAAKRTKVKGGSSKKAAQGAPSQASSTLKSALKSASHLSKGKGKKIAVTVPERPNLAEKNAARKAHKAAKAAEAGTSRDAPLPTSFKLIAGSYEKLLYGLQGTVTLRAPSGESHDASEEEEHRLEFHLKPVFAFPAHVSSVKAVAASPNGGKWLATGSTDEIVKVWDLRRQKEVGGLMHHTGSITHLTFASRTHLLSASDDGTIGLFHTRDWAVLRALKGHKGRVNALAVHPSGKLALSVGKDRTIRMWDLMRGKGSASTKIYKEGEVARWNSTGTLFAVSCGTGIDIHTTKMAVVYSITHPSRTHDMLFVPSEVPGVSILLVGAENKKVSAYAIATPAARPDTEPEEEVEEAPLEAPKIFAEFVGHDNRVKALSALRLALPTSSRQTRSETMLLATVSSDGRAHLYDLAQLPSLGAIATAPDSELSEEAGVVQIESVARYDTIGARLTCLTLAEEAAVPSGTGNDDERKKSLGEDVTVDEEEQDSTPEED